MRKYLGFVLVSCCAFVFMTASAMAFGEIRYPDRPLNLRDGRSASATWVGSLYPGQKVRVAFLKDGWVAVFEPGETRNTEDAAVGFSNVKYLKKKRTRHEPKEWGELVYTPQKLNIRDSSSIRGKKVGMLDVNERAIIDFPEDDWTMVFYPDATIRSKMNARGFSSAKYFEPVTSASPKPVANQDEVVVVEAETESAPATSYSDEQPREKGVFDEWGTVITVKQKVNVRQQRTSGSHYVRTLQPGERVRVDFLKNGWYAVFPENELVRGESRAIGYALKSLLESEGGEVAPATTEKNEVEKSTWETTDSGQKTMVIDKSSFKKTKRPDPTPNKSAHGYKYRLLDKSEIKKYGEPWITLKVFLASTKLPGHEGLRDFATTLWEKHRRVTKNLAVLIYMPGQNTDDLSYAVIQFSDEKMLEFWTRKTTLFGTDFL